jgi:uncharacterized cupin superfamily protein
MMLAAVETVTDAHAIRAPRSYDSNVAAQATAGNAVGRLSGDERHRRSLIDRPWHPATLNAPQEPFPQAELKQTDLGLIPQGEGWFVLNARDASWIRSNERGQDTDFEGGQEWTQLGFRLHVLMPGQRNGMYHRERGQEDFLVVSGECVLVIEGEERRLEAWDFVHCPPWTHHIFVGAGEGPCVIVMAGSRIGGFEVVYPVNDVAAKYGASAAQETSSPDEAYAAFGPEARAAYETGWLPADSEEP